MTEAHRRIVGLVTKSLEADLPEGITRCPLRVTSGIPALIVVILVKYPASDSVPLKTPPTLTARSVS